MGNGKEDGKLSLYTDNKPQRKILKLLRELSQVNVYKISI